MSDGIIKRLSRAFQLFDLETHLGTFLVAHMTAKTYLSVICSDDKPDFLKDSTGSSTGFQELIWSLPYQRIKVIPVKDGWKPITDGPPLPDNSICLMGHAGKFVGYAHLADDVEDVIVSSDSNVMKNWPYSSQLLPNCFGKRLKLAYWNF